MQLDADFLKEMNNMNDRRGRTEPNRHGRTRRTEASAPAERIRGMCRKAGRWLSGTHWLGRAVA